MAGTKVVSGFGLRDVAVADVPTTGGTSPTWMDIPSVESAAFQLNVEEVEQWGDDKYQGTFYHSQKGTITVKSNKLAMEVLEKLSGNAVSTGSGGEESMYFGTDLELIPPRVMVRGIIPVRNEDGTAGEMTVYWFNCDVKTLWDNAPGGERAQLVELELQFNSFPSDQDEQGDALTGGVTHAFGRFSV